MCLDFPGNVCYLCSLLLTFPPTCKFLIYCSSTSVIPEILHRRAGQTIKPMQYSRKPTAPLFRTKRFCYNPYEDAGLRFSYYRVKTSLFVFSIQIKNEYWNLGTSSNHLVNTSICLFPRSGKENGTIQSKPHRIQQKQLTKKKNF